MGRMNKSETNAKSGSVCLCAF